MADLEKLKNENLPNFELELKEDDDRWHMVVDTKKSGGAKGDLVDELKGLEKEDGEGGEGKSHNVNVAGGQPEQDDKAGYYNERQHDEEEDHDVGEDLPQPTQKQMEREQQQIDDEIRSEINKDHMETMEVSGTE